jgi:hypothetical protein
MRVPTWRTRSPMTTLVAILVKCHGYFGYRERSKRRKTSTHRRNLNGVGRWHRPGAAFCKTWSLAATLTKVQERCLVHLRMVRPGMVCRIQTRDPNAFVDADSSSARRARPQPYIALDGNRTTFHHYVPTDGSKIKPSQAVPLTGLILSTI